MLANRLSENSESRVLLLEAGPDDRGETDLSVPMNTLEVAFSGSANPFNWAFSTEPQKQALAAYSEQVFDKQPFSCTTAVVDRNHMLLSIRLKCEFTLCVDPAAECLRTLCTFKRSGCEDARRIGNISRQQRRLACRKRHSVGRRTFCLHENATVPSTHL